MSKRGFSLIELMVVVAIIGILATLGIPNYQKFRARSRQVEAKNQLGSVYVAQKSFYAEYGSYWGDLPSIGFAIAGYTFVTPVTGGGGRFDAAPGIRAHYTLFQEDNNPAFDFAAAGLVRWSSGGQFYNHHWGYIASQSLCTSVAPAPMVGPQTDMTDMLMGNSSPATTTSTFEVRSLGCPYQNITTAPPAAPLDRWSIDQNKVLKNLDSGI